MDKPQDGEGVQMAHKKPQFVPGRTIARRVGVDVLCKAVQSVSDKSHTGRAVAEELQKTFGAHIVSPESIWKACAYAKKVGIEKARADWSARIGQRNG